MSSTKSFSKPSGGNFKKPFNKNASSGDSVKRKSDGGFGGFNKRFKDQKGEKKPVILDKKARKELRKQRRATKKNAGMSFFFPFFFLPEIRLCLEILFKTYNSSLHSSRCHLSRLNQTHIRYSQVLFLHWLLFSHFTSQDCLSTNVWNGPFFFPCRYG